MTTTPDRIAWTMSGKGAWAQSTSPRNGWNSACRIAISATSRAWTHFRSLRTLSPLMVSCTSEHAAKEPRQFAVLDRFCPLSQPRGVWLSGHFGQNLDIGLLVQLSGNA